MSRIAVHTYGHGYQPNIQNMAADQKMKKIKVKEYIEKLQVWCVIKEEGGRRPEEKQNQTFGSHQKFPSKSAEASTWKSPTNDDGADHENRVCDQDNDNWNLKILVLASF